MDINSTIKENIYRIRRSKGLSQEFIAANLNISINSYRKLERGDTVIINKRIKRLAELLEVSVDEILSSSTKSYMKNHKTLPNIDDSRIKELENHIKTLNQCIDLLNDKLGYYTKTK